MDCTDGMLGAKKPTEGLFIAATNLFGVVLDSSKKPRPNTPPTAGGKANEFALRLKVVSKIADSFEEIDKSLKEIK